MKKFFSLIAAVLFAGSMVAEELLFEQTYPGSPSEFVSAYSKTFTITTDGYTLSYANINNGKESDNWDAVRAGSKNGASVASVTSAVIAGKVSKVIVNFTQVQAAKTNELYLQVADNAEFTGATKISQTIAVGAVVFEVAEPAENMFYKIVLDQAQGSANGFNRWDRIQFVSPDGEGTIDPPTQETIKATVAEAIAVGQALADGKTSEEVYEVTGFVVNAQPYNPTYNNQIWWMADDAENTGAQEFEAYACTVSENKTVMQVLNGDKVTLTGKITKYNDTKNSKIIIEISNGTAVFVSKVDGDHSIDGGVTPPAEDLDTITVAKALEIGGQLPSGGTTDVQYVIEGYVSYIDAFFSEDFKNETFFISDDKDSRTKENAFEVYRGKPNTGAEAGLGAKISVKAKIKNYNGTIENDGTNIAFEVLEASTFEPKELTVEEAVEIALAVSGDNVPTQDYYVIKGYINSVTSVYSSKYNNATFTMAQFPNEAEGALKAYQASILKADSNKVKTEGAVSEELYVNVLGYLTKFKSAAQIVKGAHVAFVEAPKEDTIHVSVAEALEAGLALPIEGKSDKVYAVTGFVNSVDGEFAEGVETFYMADDAASEAMNFLVLDVAIEAEAPVGQKVEVVGRLQNADGETVTIENGKARLLWPEGIESIVLTEKAQKVVVDGVIYIVRDNKLFNLQGAQVR